MLEMKLAQSYLKWKGGALNPVHYLAPSAVVPVAKDSLRRLGRQRVAETCRCPGLLAEMGKIIIC